MIFWAVVLFFSVFYFYVLADGMNNWKKGEGADRDGMISYTVELLSGMGPLQKTLVFLVTLIISPFTRMVLFGMKVHNFFLTVQLKWLRIKRWWIFFKIRIRAGINGFRMEWTRAKIRQYRKAIEWKRIEHEKEVEDE